MRAECVLLLTRRAAAGSFIPSSQAPSEAESLSAARSAWGRAAAGPSTPPAPTASGASAPPQPTPPPFRLLSAAAPGCVAPGAAERRTTSAEAPPLEPFGTPERSAAGDVGGPAAAGGTVAGSGHAIPALAPASGPSAPAPCVRGPLMLFPDTSAVLAMVGAANTRATPLSFQRLEARPLFRCSVTAAPCWSALLQASIRFPMLRACGSASALWRLSFSLFLPCWVFTSRAHLLLPISTSALSHFVSASASSPPAIRCPSAGARLPWPLRADPSPGGTSLHSAHGQRG